MPEIEKYLGGLEGKKIALWGLAFKENTDDIREASSLEMIDALLQKGAQITAYDAAAMDNVKNVLGDSIQYADNMYDCTKDADVLVISTEWSEFRNPNFDIIAQNLQNKAIFDGRNLYDLNEMEEQGFYYNSIGRKTVLN